MQKHRDIAVRMAAIVVSFLVSVVNEDGWNAFYMNGAHPLLGFCFIVLFWELNRFVFLRLYKKLLPEAGMGRRLLIIFTAGYIVTFILRALYFYTEAWLYQLPPVPDKFWWNNVLNCIMAVWPFIVTYEMLFVNRFLRQVEEEKEALVQANLQGQYDSLMEQVNPHFLFNNLNSLSTLITKDPDKADEFVIKMSSVYRYLLRNNEDNLTTLREELGFIESYNHLLKTRFGEGFQPLISIPDASCDLALPPMTLQLLVENAVKHNIVSPEEPLELKIFTEGDYLLVTNNLQKKNRPAASAGVGLFNIQSRYRLLNQPAVEIWQTDKAFTVKLPLIHQQ
jgi:hypothetical protein